ncbi:hypothetical protein [Pectobacterium carotovorum]|uniref:hypothetical protein n=1 Tax=Pectobacterium carotovorum TaxID=554 RepID=UPI0001A432A0|nr:hypothetical protein [Pectobacterium carotovorum]MBL0866513.1 hypothetical protein [Pectobacterium carotovorum]MDK9422223.1 hypothetical protein [Pectobacterium carotovorum]QHP58839.1 hypothetical protein EH204_13175 [Pectobacterium carotovorum subsp. carotovorum]QLL93894.1 hypothetical protein HER17_13480 [Pectobacterium carotovorum]GKW36753.1 hypothetical protein PEC301875_07770 [Pectobacterium carotovorum subsp. carotovorum]
MSKRSEIVGGSTATMNKSGLIYSEVLGWVDLGHAQGDDIRKLLPQFEAGESGVKPYYDVKYFQDMRKFRKRVGTSKYTVWRIKKGVSRSEQFSIALAMMMKVAYRFEGLQGGFPFNFFTDSGFSGEDLVSDLLGFYRVVDGIHYFSELKPVSRDEALKRWDFYGPIGMFKNESFRPLLFPDPDKNPNARPYFGVLPAFMTRIKPYASVPSERVDIVTDDGTGLHLKLSGG